MTRQSTNPWRVFPWPPDPRDPPWFTRAQRREAARARWIYWAWERVLRRLSR